MLSSAYFTNTVLRQPRERLLQFYSISPRGLSQNEAATRIREGQLFRRTSQPVAHLVTFSAALTPCPAPSSIRVTGEHIYLYFADASRR